MARLLTAKEIAVALADELPAWTADADAIVRSVEAASFPAGIALVDAVALVAEEMNHHPDIDIRWTTATFRLSTHSAGGVTDLDLALARRIDSLADSAAAAR